MINQLIRAKSTVAFCDCPMKNVRQSAADGAGSTASHRTAGSFHLHDVRTQSFPIAGATQWVTRYDAPRHGSEEFPLRSFRPKAPYIGPSGAPVIGDLFQYTWSLYAAVVAFSDEQRSTMRSFSTAAIVPAW